MSICSRINTELVSSLTLTTMQCVKKKNIWTWSTKWVNYRCVRFVHLSMSSLGVFADECSTFLDLDKNQQLYNQENDHIAIRATYYIFCCRNRNWDSPDLLECWYLFFPFFLSFFLFCFVLFFFWIIQSQAVFVNYQYVARFTIVHSKTQIKFPLDKTVKTVPTCLQGF